MKYLVSYLKNETPELNKSNVRLEAIGQIWWLHPACRAGDLSRPSTAVWA